MVDELTAKGVTFEQYGEPFNTDEKGIARFESGAAGAWPGSETPTATTWHGLRLRVGRGQLVGIREPEPALLDP